MVLYLIIPLGDGIYTYYIISNQLGMSQNWVPQYLEDLDG